MMAHSTKAHYTLGHNVLRLADLRDDEKRYINGSQTNLSVLSAHDSPAMVMVMRNAYVAFEAAVVFSFFMGAGMCEKWWLALLVALPGFAVLLWRFLVVAVFIASGYAAHFWKNCYRRAIIFWLWLPVVALGLCILAAILGGILGMFLWQNSLEPYHELSYLQRYTNVDPSIAQGQGLMDSGRVYFTADAAIDRSHGGCFFGRGHTYCVAPILPDGQLKRTSTGGSPRGGSYDFFAVGVDCCTCPNYDFRCGAWDNEKAKGGLRSIDYAARPFFKLAVDGWKANYGKVVDHALFFEWVEDPDYVWHRMFEWPVSLACCASLVALLAFFTVAIFLGQLLQFLIHHNIANPMDTPPPPPGYERLWYTFLPDMLFFHEEEKRQYLGLPETTPAPFYERPDRSGSLAAPRGMATPAAAARAAAASQLHPDMLTPAAAARARAAAALHPHADTHAATAHTPLTLPPPPMTQPHGLPPPAQMAAAAHPVSPGVPTMAGMGDPRGQMLQHPPPVTLPPAPHQHMAPQPGFVPVAGQPMQYGTILDGQAVAGHPMSVY